MIQLDTNYLIRLLVAGSPQAIRVDQWFASRESLAASALAWTEFLNGPVPAPQFALVESVIGSSDGKIPHSSIRTVPATDASVCREKRHHAGGLGNGT